MDLLILHGWGSCARNWQKVKEIIEKKGYRVFAPDLPGFGENPQPSEPWFIDDYVNWIKEYCEKNNLSQFFLLGHSFGGGLAVKLAGALPGRVQKLILVGAKIRRQKTLRYYAGLVLGKTGNLIFSLPVLSLFRSLGRKVLYALMGTRDYYVLEVKKAVTMKETFKKVIGEDLTADLSCIKAPTLIVWGRKDRLTPLKDAYLIKKKIAGSKLEIIENQGHVPNLEAPKVLAEKVLNFIE